LLLAPCLFFPGPHPFTVTIGYTLYYLGFGALLALALSSSDARDAQDVRAGRIERWLAAIGAYSYSIYLWHAASKHWSAPVWKAIVGSELGYAGQVVLYFASSLVLGIAMAKLIELPFLRWRDVAFPSRSGSAAPAAVAGLVGVSAAEGTERPALVERPSPILASDAILPASKATDEPPVTS